MDGGVMAEWTEIYRDSQKRIERRATGAVDSDGSAIFEERTTYTNTNEDTLRTHTRAALDANRTFLGLASPSATQNSAQIKALTRQVQALIRFTLDDLTGAD